MKNMPARKRRKFNRELRRARQLARDLEVWQASSEGVLAVQRKRIHDLEREVSNLNGRLKDARVRATVDRDPSAPLTYAIRFLVDAQQIRAMGGRELNAEQIRAVLDRLRDEVLTVLMEQKAPPYAGPRWGIWAEVLNAACAAHPRTPPRAGGEEGQ